MSLQSATVAANEPVRDGPLQRIRLVRDYLEEVRRVDVSRVEDVRRDPQRVGRLLRSLARNSGMQAAATTLAHDAGGGDGPLHDDTVRDYLAALQRLMVVEDQPAWAPHLRSRAVLRRSPKRHFVDPSLAVAALRATPDRLLDDLELFGCLFESLVVRDLRIYGQAADAEVYHYRDNTDLEVDAIVEAADGLLKLADRVDGVRSGDPSLLGVIVGPGYGFVRDDGVAVIPIGALGP